MALKRQTFSLQKLNDYVDAHGGLWALMEDRGLTYEEKGDLEGRYGKLPDNYAAPIPPFAPHLTLDAADKMAIEVVGTHPANIWVEWFDEEPNTPNYGEIEDELLLGRFDSRAEFWAYVEDLLSQELGKNERPRFMATLPVIPGGRVMQIGNRLRALAVGSTCKNGHEIKTEGDLMRDGTVRSCRTCKRNSNAASRARKKAEMATKKTGEAA